MTISTQPAIGSALQLPESARQLIESGVLAHVVTMDPDGRPRVACVWVGIDDGAVTFASMYRWRKTDNLQRDPRVALSIESPDSHPSGLRQYLVIRGRARISRGGAFEFLRRRAAVYMGPGADFPPPELRGRLGYVTRIDIEDIGGVGPWAGGPPGPPKGDPAD